MAIIQETNVNLATHVRDVLNAAGGSVSNDVTTFFKSAAKLNMWSRYKPVVIANVPFINLWDNEAYKGDDEQCGITIPVYTSYTNLQTALKNNTGHFWSYTPPTGGTSKPMRLGDFRRYNTDAINPIGRLPSSLAVTRISGTDYLDLSVEVNVQSGHPTNLGLADFTVNSINLSDMYLGVYLVRKSGGKSDYFRTFTKPIGEESTLDMRIPLTYDEGGTFMAYMFLSSVQQGTTANNGTFVSLNKAGEEVKIVGAGTTHVISVIPYVSAVGSKEYTVEVYLKNNGSSSVTFENVYVRVKYNGQVEGTAQLVTSSQVVAANSEVTLTRTFTHSKAFDYNGLESGMFSIYAYSETPAVTGNENYFEAPAPEE